MILNINTYYFTSSLYKELEDELVKNNVSIQTYVAVEDNYFCRKECQGEVAQNVIVSKCLKKYDRTIFKLKHKKIFDDIENKINFSNIKIIHAHSLFSNGYIAWNLYMKYKIPYIVIVQNTDVNIFFKYMIHLRKLGIDILLNASKVIFFSETYRDLVINKYISKDKQHYMIEKSEVIPSGLTEYWIKNKNNKKDKNKNKIKLLYVGSINKNKNLEVVINACKNLIKNNINVEYTIVGEIYEDKLKKIIERESFIKYIPHTTRESLINIYRENDIFVMPSINESFGLVYLEAMSQGLPVIYTKGQGFDKHFDDGVVGYSVNCMDKDEIANCIQKIDLDYDRISKNCMLNIDKFEWKNIANKYCDIYDKISN